jgi:hypothetical protein
MNLSFARFRYYSGLSGTLALLTILLLAQDAGGSQEAQSQACPSPGEIRSELTIRKDKLLNLKSGLEAFMAGKRVTEIPMAALFMIDPSDAKAVAQRAEQLQRRFPGPKA